MTTPLVPRATMLMQLGRFDEAATLLGQVLAENPNDGHIHALLAHCRLEQNQLGEATTHAETAVGLAPDADFPYYVLARTWIERGYADRALTAIDEAIRIAPEDP